ncbi:hypothetical protein [Marinobacter sp. ANT_B65]|uniref:hypothetical protein n=1 Tax=Marinobacter sp. ANT_B65 TaxID=2039467 RepID=UPI000BBEEA09|nr:hypothetical protein [Marinobacter sp. ANT_B65]PCM45390.1 hypothetical protein CPA50_05120 [Marinobacter sp. ANT_B65]
MSIDLFPRLRRSAVDQLLDKINPTAKGSAFTLASSLPDGVYYAPTGGSKVSYPRLVEIRAAILEIAKSTGYPKLADRARAADFDTEVAIWLSEIAYMDTGEFLRDDVWACIATALLPDVVIWRFSLGARDRFHGGIRNAFQRLWLRSRILDRGKEHPQRWELLRELSEDALVQITERPSIAGNKALSIALAEGWLFASRKYGASKMEDLMRRVTLQTRLQNEIQHLPSMPSGELEELINNLFDDAAEAFGLSLA